MRQILGLFVACIVALAVVIVAAPVPGTAGQPAPVANNDAYTMVCGSSFTAGENGIPSLFANDVGLFDGSSGATLGNLPGEGLFFPGPFSWYSNGKFNVGANPCTSFGTLPVTYRLGYVGNQGGLSSNQAMFTITVTAPPPSPPIAVDDIIRVPSQTGYESPRSYSIRANDTPTAGIACTWEAVGSLPTNVTIAPAGNVVISSGDGRQGNVTLQYRINCGTEVLTSNAATVTLNFNSPPVGNPLTVTIVEDAFQGIGTLTATDANGDSVSFMDLPSDLQGFLMLSGNRVTYIPNPNQFGVETFSVVPRDQYDSGEPFLVTISITPVNDPPTARDETLDPIDEDVTPVRIPFATLLGNDNPGPSESSVDSVTITAVTAGTGGSVEIDGSDVVFSPTPDFNGDASFSYTVRDNGGLTETATATFTVNAVNDPPVVTPDPITFTVDEDSGPHDIPFSVSDPEGAEVEIEVIGGATALGTVSSSDEGLTLTLLPNAFGEATVTLRATDAESASSDVSVVITVRPVNDPPTASDDTLTASLEETPRTISSSDLLSNDSPGPLEAAVDSISVSSVGGPVGGTVTLDGASIRFDPADDFTGAASFSYEIEDEAGETATATARFTITATDDPPVPVSVIDAAVTEDVGASGQLTATDVDTGQSDLVFALVEDATNGTATVSATGA